jgi:hypothetical protein
MMIEPHEARGKPFAAALDSSAQLEQSTDALLRQSRTGVHLIESPGQSHEMKAPSGSSASPFVLDRCK